MLRGRGKVINLTIAQARELQELLNETFGKEKIIYNDYWYHRPNPFWYTTSGLSNITTTAALNCNTTAWNGKITSDTVTFKAAA